MPQATRRIQVGRGRVAVAPCFPLVLHAGWTLERQTAVIVALGALVGMLGGVVTAAPALARGPKWQFVQVPPSLTLKAMYCGFKIRQTFPVKRAYAKILKSSDGSMTSLINGSVKPPSPT